MGLNIVLFEPEIPQNTGNIARTCGAIGATLHLVHPLGFELSDRYLKRCGLDYWHLLEIKEWPSVENFLSFHPTSPLWFFTTKAPQLYSEVSYGEEAYLVFGKETRGIAESILINNWQQCVRIPIRGEARSLNLSNSVAIGAFEWERQHHFAGLKEKGELSQGGLKWVK
ncbi:MAG: tRNA (cytidine(34)-2'-O)-methyltransferase [Sphaerochaetaceae bacterium]|jgi:tRNA (cytidine/uridine-2'-O-)-methyltransferase|nr:tRNA (cytidine(34)-2'-O)-methyltransferase [Sphaerochaetaceae bacterium]HHU89343.1 tRNA (cytidine(34)-2'-O)-methyltransferase [Spirochaetales bacterium]